MKILLDFSCCEKAQIIDWIRLFKFWNQLCEKFVNVEGLEVKLYIRSKK